MRQLKLYIPRQCLAFLLIFLSFSVWTQDKKHAPKPENQSRLTLHKEAYKTALKNKDYGIFFSAIDSVKDHFYSKMQFDSMINYSLLTAQVADQIDSFDQYAHNAMNAAEIYKMSHRVEEYNQIINELRDKNLKLNLMNQMRFHGHMESVYKNLDLLDSAYLENTKGIEVARIRGDSMAIAAFYRNLAQLRRREGNYSEAIEMLMVGSSYINKEGNYIKAQTYRSIGDLFVVINDISRAEEYYKLGFDLTDSDGLKSIHNEFVARMGVIAFRNQDYNLAKNYMRQSLNYNLKRKKNAWTFSNYCTLAEIANLENDYGTAEILLDSAYLYYNDQNSASLNLRYYKSFALLKMHQKRFAEAKPFIQKVEQLSKESSLPGPKLGLAELKWKYAENVGNIADAYRNMNRYHTLKDSLDDIAKNHRVHTLESQYNRLEQDKTIANLNYENEVNELKVKSRNRWLLFGGVGLTLLSILLAFTSVLFVKNRKKKRQLEEQNVIINKALEDKNTLLKEIHHRVKNNLQVISSLLGLQSRYVKDDNVLDAIKSGRSRVQSMSLLHQNLYRTENLKGVDMKKYFSNLAQNLFDTYNLEEKNIALEVDIEDIDLDIDSVVPIGLITNELISNALKHAFINQKDGKILLTLKEIDGILELRVTDNGIGLPDGNLPQNGESLGVNLIQSFAEKLEADISINNEAGTDILFRIKNYRKAS